MIRDYTARIRGHLFRLNCFLRNRNLVVGRGLRVYGKLCVEGPGLVHIGENFTVYGVIGDRSQRATIQTLRTDAIVRIGDNVKFYAARISAKFSVTIGSDVVIEESGIVDTNFHRIERDRIDPLDETIENSAVIIGDGVSIGSRSFVLRGVMVGNNAAILPGSIVNRSIPASTVVIGNPAKIIRSYGT